MIHNFYQIPNAGDYLVKYYMKENKKISNLIKGSDMLTKDFKIWETHRKFISQAINKGGIILDIGCANGFLLKCLQNWSVYKLIPYGIDRDEKRIEQAKDLFPLYSDNFMVARVPNFTSLLEYKFPAQFDFIYWNVWDLWNFESQSDIKFLEILLKMVSNKGRLILGFYESDKNKEKKIKKIKELGFKFSGMIKNYGGKEIIIWIDKLINQTCEE